MSDNDSNTGEITENPLVIYLNRLQRQMIIITDLLYNSKTDVNSLKRRLLGLIDNLPPQAQTKFASTISVLKNGSYVSVNDLSSYYSEIHTWAYEQLLKETQFGLMPTASLPGKKEAPEHRPLNPKQTSRI